MIRYIVNEEKRTVTAIISNCRFDAIRRVLKRGRAVSNSLGCYIASMESVAGVEVTFDSADEFESYNGSFIEHIVEKHKPLHIDKLIMPNKIVATAKCNPNDEFDESIGVQIASEKVKAKYKDKLNKALTRWKTALCRDIDIASEEM